MVFFGSLIHDFWEEIVDGGVTKQGDFAQSARVQEIINAVVLSHREHRRVALPLEGQNVDVGGVGERRELIDWLVAKFETVIKTTVFVRSFVCCTFS